LSFKNTKRYYFYRVGRQRGLTLFERPSRTRGHCGLREAADACGMMSSKGCCARCTVRADRLVGGVPYLVPEGVELRFKPHEGSDRLCRGCKKSTDAEIAAAVAARHQTRAAVAPARQKQQRTCADASLLLESAAAAAELAPQSQPGYQNVVSGAGHGMQAMANALLHLDPVPDVASLGPVPDSIMAEAVPSKHMRVRLM
jgi:hypothetical protein